MGVEIEPFYVARELFPDYPTGFPFEGFDFDNLQLPDDDDFGVPSDEDDVEEDEVEAETGFGSVIVVSDLPQIVPEKYERLQTVIERVFSKFGLTIRKDGFYMPKDPETQITKGFAFIEFISPEQAQEARKQTQGYQLDKNYKFSVSMFDDFDKYSKVPDEYKTPDVKEYQPQENFHEYMLDKQGRDQFVIRYGDETAVFWNDGKRGRADEAYKRTFWTESYVQWSPQGSLLATIHRQGIAVWGGPSFTRVAKYSHPGVTLIECSPNDKYLISYSSQAPSNPRESVMVVLNVFDVRSGKKLRIFEAKANEFAVGATAGPGGALKWPIFKWAGGPEDLYFARLGKGLISVYAAPGMGLLDNRSLKMDGVHDFEWSPSEPVLCAYTSEMGNLPARISLVRIPDRIELRQKNLFSVSDVKIYWHPQGDYLAVKVDRFTKTKKSTYTGFELFSIRERDIPMEVLEMPNKVDKIIAFAWEPHGHRFCIVHGSEGPRPNVSFYTMKDDKGRLGVKHLSTLQQKSCNTVYWSPAGRTIVLAGLKSLNGQLEFLNVDEMETTAAAEHFMATDVEWDPTGRYVATSVTAIAQMENGFNIWSFSGRLLYSSPRDRFFQFSWRPRLPSLLPAEKEAEIVKNLKTYSRRYEEEDEALILQADADVLTERQRMLDDWLAWLASKRGYIAQLEEFRRTMLGERYEEAEFTMESVTVEQTIDNKEEVYSMA